MAEPNSRAVTVVQDWPGVETNVGTMGGAAPGSAVEQVNLAVNVPGQLAARPGYRKVQFDDEED
jgi:hypothetical protein